MSRYTDEPEIVWHPPTPPTTDGDREEHPAWGVISAHRISSTPGAVLFDSEIAHSEFIRVTVGRMTRRRDLSQDWLHASSRLPLIEVDMSLAQWASFVSSMNTSGVPCTIRGTETDHNLPGLEFAPRLALSAQEARESAHKAFSKIEAAAQALIDLGPSAPVKARREALRRLEVAVQNAPADVEFAAQQLTRHTEDVVTKARADIEAMVETHARTLGIEPGDLTLPALGQGPADSPAEP